MKQKQNKQSLTFIDRQRGGNKFVLQNVEVESFEYSVSFFPDRISKGTGTFTFQDVSLDFSIKKKVKK